MLSRNLQLSSLRKILGKMTIRFLLLMYLLSKTLINQSRNNIKTKKLINYRANACHTENVNKGSEVKEI